MLKYLSRLAPLKFLRLAEASGHIFHPTDIGLFLQGSRIDAKIEKLRKSVGDHAAFNAIYQEYNDPWASVSTKYRYQQRKYEVIISLLPPSQRFHSALDLGCGLGDLSRRLAERSETVLGLDVANSAIEQARAMHGNVAGMSFDQCDILDIPNRLDQMFDLVTIADSIYYISPMSDDLLKKIASRVSRLLTPGGVCLLANHYFFGTDRDSKLSRRIHHAFHWSDGFLHVSDHWRPFYLVSVLTVPEA